MSAGQWVEWAGGECPVWPGTLVDIEMHGGARADGICAERLDWSARGRWGGIVAWRVSALQNPGPAKSPMDEYLDDTRLEYPAPAYVAPDLLAAACEHMVQRAATYDKPEGERSMGRAVEAFNAITGRDIEESEGWLLMQLLKDVRDRQRREPHRDSLEDCIAYAALKAEARLAGR